MRKGILLIAIIFTTLCVNAQYPGYKPVASLDAFKEKFAAASQKTTAIKSDFQQEKNLSMLSEKIVSNGRFWFKKENLVRMEYTKPFQYLMVINGNKVYVKDGQKENTISTSSNKLFKQINNIMVDCMKGTALNNPDFKVKVFEGNTHFLVELTPVPKNLKELFKNINIIVDKKDYGAGKIEMHEQSGDNTIITFTNKELNANIPDALFAIK
jgi:outer membrane lipoprotein-sorting protein